MRSVPSETPFLCSVLRDQSPAPLPLLCLSCCFSSPHSYILNTEGRSSGSCVSCFVVKFVSHDSKRGAAAALTLGTFGNSPPRVCRGALWGGGGGETTTAAVLKL